MKRLVECMAEIELAHQRRDLHRQLLQRPLRRNEGTMNSTPPNLASAPRAGVPVPSRPHTVHLPQADVQNTERSRTEFQPEVRQPLRLISSHSSSASSMLRICGSVIRPRSFKAR